MLPVILHPEKANILVIGNGLATQNRLALLDEAGMCYRHLSHWEGAKSLQEIMGEGQVVRNETASPHLNPLPEGEGVIMAFIADFDESTSAALYAQAKEAGCLVNVEDKKDYCDFYVPARVRRGDLLLTISTGGGSPRLARRLRMMLETLFPVEWGDRLTLIKQKRHEWKAAGAGFTEVADKTDVLLDAEGWLQASCPCLQNNHSPLAGEWDVAKQGLIGGQDSGSEPLAIPPTKSSGEDLTPPQGGSVKKAL